jgi:hypothetical protein
MDDGDAMQMLFLFVQKTCRLPTNEIAEGLVVGSHAKTIPSIPELLLKIYQKLALTGPREHSLPLRNSQFNRILGLHPVVVDEPGADDHKGAASACVAMHTDLALAVQAHVEDVHDLHHLLECRGRHVFPALVEAVYAVVVKILRDVAKADLREDTVPAVGVLRQQGFT